MSMTWSPELHVEHSAVSETNHVKQNLMSWASKGERGFILD